MASDLPEVHELVLRFLRDPAKVASTVQAGWYVGSRSRTLASWDVRSGVDCLHVCAWHGLIFAIPRVLDGDLDLEVDSTDALGRTPLMYACKRGHHELASLLLRLHADPNIESTQGRTAIVEAIVGNHVECVKVLLGAKNIDINKSFAKRDGFTILMIAAQYEKADIVDCLLQQDNINVNLKDSKDWSALCLASTKTCLATVNSLLNRKELEIDSVNENGASALIIAAEYGREQIVKTLLERHANPALKDHEGGTAIFRAMQNGHPSVVTAMLNSHVDFSGIDDMGRNLLHSACLLEEAQPDIVRLLISDGMEVDAPDKFGQTPLHMASRAGNLEIVSILTSLGANPVVKDAHERTPLEVAWQHGRTDVIKTLVAKTGKEVPNDMSLPLWALAKLGRKDLIEPKIQGKNLKLDERDPDTGRTALHVSQH